MFEDQLTLHCFPSSDEEFRRVAEELLGPADPATSSETARAAFEARLRAHYPGATVRVRDAWAAMGDGTVWYVHRGSIPASPPRWRVLIVEDDRNLARMIATAMSSEGADVRSAADGRAALAVTDSWQPDAIVLDLGLPGLDGQGFAAAYRARGATVPIVVVSGEPDASSTSERIGARAWLPKPFELDHLIDLVRPSEGQTPGALP